MTVQAVLPKKLRVQNHQHLTPQPYTVLLLDKEKERPERRLSKTWISRKLSCSLLVRSSFQVAKSLVTETTNTSIVSAQSYPISVKPS